MLRRLKRKEFFRCPHRRRGHLLQKVFHLTVPSAFLRYFEDKDHDAASQCEARPDLLGFAGTPSLAIPSLSSSLYFFRGEKPTRSASNIITADFLQTSHSGIIYLHAHVWATGMTFVISMVKYMHIFYLLVKEISSIFQIIFKVILQVSFVVLIVVNIHVEIRKLRLSNLLWLLLLSPTQLGMSVFLTTALYLYARLLYHICEQASVNTEQSSVVVENKGAALTCQSPAGCAFTSLPYQPEHQCPECSL